MLTKEALEAAITDAYEAQPDRAAGKIRQIYEDVIAAVQLFDAKGNDKDEIRTKTDLDKACTAIDEALKEVEILPAMRRRLAQIRLRIRATIEAGQGWAKTRDDDGNPLPILAQAFNRFRMRMNMKPALIICGQPALSPEEFEQLYALARALGAKALAKFIAIYKNLPYDDTVEALSGFLGEVELPSGGSLVDVPVALLDDARFVFMREMLRNHYRDQLDELYREEGIDAVLEGLQKSREAQPHPLQQVFIGELEEFFLRVELAPEITTLKKGLVPRRDQWEVVREVERHGSYLDAKYMGGGKTLTGILAGEYLLKEGKIDAVWVICPSNVLNDVWRKRISAGKEGYFEHKPNVVFISAKKQKEDDAKRADEWAAAATATHTVLTIERANAKTQEMAHIDWLRKISEGKKVLLLIDEAHNLRDSAGSESKNIFEISQLPAVQQGYLLLLTGTPADGSIKDLASIIRLLYANRTLPALPGTGANDVQPSELVENEEGVLNQVDFSDAKSIGRTIVKSPEFARAALQAKMFRRTAAEMEPVGTDLIVEEPRIAELPPLVRAQCDAIVENPFMGTLEKMQLIEQLCMQARVPYLIDAIDDCLADADAQPGHPGKFIIAASGRAKGVSRDAHDHNTAGRCDAESFVAGRLRAHYEARNIPLHILDGSNTGNTPLRDATGIIIDPADGGPMTRTRQVIAVTRDEEGKAGLFTRPDVAGQGISLAFAQYLIEAGSFHTDGVRQQMIHRLHRPGQKWPVRILTVLFRGYEHGKWSRSRSMATILRKILDDEDLTAEEVNEVEQELEAWDEQGTLKQHTRTPLQRLAYLFGCIFGGGKDHVRRFFALKDGAVARELAELYFEHDDISMAGNNRRLLTAILDRVSPELISRFGSPLHVANIASGCLRLERALMDRKEFEFYSSDICEPMLEIGKTDWPAPPSSNHIDTCPMDELPYARGSKHIAIHSFALYYAQHNQRHQNNGGRERVDALVAWSDCICNGGIGILALPPNLFEKDAEKVQKLTELLERCFGFERVVELTGHAQSTDRTDEHPFNSYIWTLRKVRPSRADLIMDEDWRTLNLKKSSRANGGGRKTNGANGTQETQGSFHENFCIGSTELQCITNVDVSCAVMHDHGVEQHRTIAQRIRELREKHGSFDAIPAHELLAFSLDDLNTATQHEKNAYFEALLRRYHGDVYRIPIEQIKAKSPLILMCQKANAGTFLSFAVLDDRGQARPYGKRYFSEAEFATQGEGGPITDTNSQAATTELEEQDS
jgi:hypothetical protein